VAVCLIRIEVMPEAAPFKWADHVRLSGISRQMARALERVARRDGSDPSDWRVSYEPVPIEQWTAVEMWHEEQWRDVSDVYAALTGAEQCA
jgi:hypothetical protein